MATGLGFAVTPSVLSGYPARLIMVGGWVNSYRGDIKLPKAFGIWDTSGKGSKEAKLG